MPQAAWSKCLDKFVSVLFSTLQVILVVMDLKKKCMACLTERNGSYNVWRDTNLLIKQLVLIIFRFL